MPISISRLQHSERVYAIHWDDEIKGFGVRVTESGARSGRAPSEPPSRQKIACEGPFLGALSRKRKRRGALRPLCLTWEMGSVS